MRIKLKTMLPLLLTILSLWVGAIPAQAASTYDTYTYDIYGRAKITPDAYLPLALDPTLDIFQDELVDPSDLFVDSKGNIYVVNTGKNEIIAYNPDYSRKQIYNGYYADGEMREFKRPEGIFVTDDGLLYIADTENKQLVVLEESGAYVKTLAESNQDIMSTVTNYAPIAVAVDSADRIYVVSRNATVGVICMDQEGTVQGFLGAPPVSANLWERFWRMFQSEEQRERSKLYIPNQFNNLTIDSDNFLYVTTDKISPSDQYAAAASWVNVSNNAPVKKLSPSGANILPMGGFFPPYGDIEVRHSGISAADIRPSRFADIAVAENGQYSILDYEYKRVFTYSPQGELLYAFGKRDGTQVGTFSNPSAIAYKGTDILVLDKSNGNINIFYRTSYGDGIAQAISLQESREFEQAREVWADLLHQNSNLDIAHIGIGNTYYRQGDYKAAMESFKTAGVQSQYSKAYAEYRKDLIRQNFGWIVLAVLVIGAGVWFFSRWLRAINRRVYVQGEKPRLSSAMATNFRLLVRPLKVYNEMTINKEGSIVYATIILGLTVLTFLFQNSASGYLFSSTGGSSPVSIVVIVLLLFGLWCVCNWALTTLMDGEGSLLRIYIVSAYALLPIPLLLIPQTLLSHVLTYDENGLYALFGSLAVAWVGLLLFFGTLSVHDYTFGKNILAIIMIIAFMIFVVFIGLLFTDLIQRMVNFIISIYNEIHYRL